MAACLKQGDFEEEAIHACDRDVSREEGDDEKESALHVAKRAAEEGVYLTFLCTQTLESRGRTAF